MTPAPRRPNLRAWTWCAGTWCAGTWCAGTWCVGTWCVGTWVAALLAMGLSVAAAQNNDQVRFPTRAIRIVSPFAAGSVSDISLRLFADKLAARLNGQIVIDNQPRAGGVTAAAAVLSSPPDGYTIALFSTSTAISVSLFKQLPYDPVRDFAPVSMLSTFANVLATNVNSKYATLADVIADRCSSEGEHVASRVVYALYPRCERLVGNDEPSAATDQIVGKLEGLLRGDPTMIGTVSSLGHVPPSR